MTDKTKLINFLQSRLIAYYEQVKSTGEPDELETRYINGVMAAIRILNALTREELETMVKAAHVEVFGMTFDARKMHEALSEGGEHWDFYESPTIERRPKSQ